MSTSTSTAISLKALAERIGASVRGDDTFEVEGLATLAKATATQVAFLANPKYQSQLETTAAGAVIVHPKQADLVKGHALISANPYLSYAKAAQVFDKAPQAPVGVHPSAVVDPSAEVAEGVSIGPQAVVSAGAVIGKGSIIGAQCFVGENARIGEYCRLWANVTVYYEVVIGDRCLFHSGVVLGSDGFGWANDAGKWVKIPQLGSVIIGDDVEIGANSTVDRGALDDTIIESNVILDNLCLIAHNVTIGSGSAIAGKTGIAGSAKIGRNCMFGGATAINGHIEIADNVQLHGMSMVTRSITEAGVYASGIPAMEQGAWAKAGVRYKQLPDLFNRVRALEKKSES
ncbi:UDP-3-O-(3-hydroxymyristoyl)glucosamine N-acyltransferase [Aliidiomarina celeris]|uniref:UDP-3-O-(3-hydroxymyristoyl)glucosamine N-acyltransferase n=1 Tax=Aliidiomarina celeris TaxID=2249428 RepID=UPI000DEAE04D|nr:UDP-3-O-(3-hydroxymyristoyl)glucosamine N-acyltransferase [Aliidiomarina celeris]